MADGVQFLQLFNYLFNERMNFKMSNEANVDARVSNWNKINASICFNFLQQRFILISSTMHALAAAKPGAATKVVSYLIDSVDGSQFSDWLDDESLKEIGDVMNWEESSSGTPTN